MPTTTAEKLRIKPGQTLRTLNAPPAFQKDLGKLPSGVKFTDNGKSFDQLHWFIQTKAQLEKELSRVMKLLNENVTVWVYYPKGSSGLQTDLTRDKGWDCLMAEKDKLTYINLISFNATWSAFGFRTKSDADKKKEAKTAPAREILQYINPQTKEVKLPDDLTALLKKNKTASEYFHSLAYSHKKEYVEWIVTAKREETRQKRLQGTIDLLLNKWKNPTTQS